MATAIEFREMSVALPDGRRLLDRISLAMEEGSRTAVLGRSGSGKTTLLRTVNRMAEPTSGSLWIKGQEAGSANLIPLRRSIGYVIQETGLFPHMTAERDVALVLEANGCAKAERLRRSHELLASVGLEPAQFARRYPHQLSGGQRQRVGLARALAAEPQVLLMDEPFGALDPLTRAEMQDMLRKLLQRLSTTVLLVTHDLDEALYLGDRIVLLEAGRVAADLERDAFLHSREPAVAEYVRAFRRGERAVEEEQR